MNRGIPGGSVVIGKDVGYNRGMAAVAANSAPSSAAAAAGAAVGELAVPVGSTRLKTPVGAAASSAPLRDSGDSKNTKKLLSAVDDAQALIAELALATERIDLRHGGAAAAAADESEDLPK